ncbi:MAG TPA: ATP-binding protein [Anaerolineae bacterium]|nr:ATP-binding protein [Anaerolineae bacterium]
MSLNVPQLPIILGDGDRLMQVFTNLLDNALKHTPNGGTITVEGSVVEVESVQGDGHQPMVEISVTDTGPGIPPEDLPHIFERFYQVDKSRPGGRGGSGLGLAIVKEIVEAHGGHVHAESVVGLGSRFIVALPLPEENSQ